MATANIELMDGTKIAIVGTPEEIARVLALYGKDRLPSVRDSSGSAQPTARIESARPERREGTGRVRNSVMQQIRELIHEGYFSDRQTISTVQAKLEELGRIYPLTHLSTPLRRLVINKELRRIRDSKNWVYVDV